MAEPRASTSLEQHVEMQPASTSTTPAHEDVGPSAAGDETDGWRLPEHPQISNADEILGLLLSNVNDSQGRTLISYLHVSAGRSPCFNEIMTMLSHGQKGASSFYTDLENVFKDALRLAEVAANDEEAYDFQEDALELAADAEDAEDEAEELARQAARRRRRAQKWDAEHGNLGSAQQLLDKKEEDEAVAAAAAEASNYASRVDAADSGDEQGAEFVPFEHVGFYAVVLQVLHTESFMIVYNLAHTSEDRRNHVVQWLFDRGVYGPCLIFRRAPREGSTREYDILDCTQESFLSQFSEELMDISGTGGNFKAFHDFWRDVVFDVMTTPLGRKLRRWWMNITLRVAWGEGDDDDQRHTR